MKHSAPPQSSLALYVHWPFCTSKCPYCDFNSHVATVVDTERWGAALVSEIRRVKRDTPDHVLSSIFFGGGTPSLMSPEVVETVIETARAEWRVVNDLEITLEANPGSVDVGKFRSFQSAGVNRISIGVQALNDTDLRRLGRMHSADDARRAVDIALACFERVSFDLIYARQEQTEEAWAAELSQALSIGTDHLSLYQLTIEQDTVFGDRHRLGQLRGLPDEDRSVAMFEVTQALTEAAGMPAYEVSNHARSGAACRHNLTYWQAGDYAGIGPGAHGRLTLPLGRVATEALRDPAEWLSLVGTGAGGELPRVALSADDVLEERVMMGLRLRDGMELAPLRDSFGAQYPAKEIDELQHLGLLDTRDGRIRTTASGTLVLNSILRTLLTAG